MWSFPLNYLRQQMEHSLLLIMPSALKLVNIHKQDSFLSEKISRPDALQVSAKFSGGDSATFFSKLG